MSESKETLAEHIQNLRSDELIDPWSSEKSFIPWFIPKWVWDLPVEEAKIYLKKIGLLKENE